MASALEQQQRTSRILASSSSLNQVLQSDTVRRLFNQPNIVIHAIPRTDSPTAYRMVKQIPSTEKNNGINKECELSNKPEVSIDVINTSTKDTNEEENFLPSKTNGKSEILLVPITRKRKPCGHFEPCESLVCNVYVQQYEDEDGSTPLIAINITDDDDDDIDSRVKKHCENIRCDALSIDHDRCRRGSIQLFNCDKCTMCDICGIKFPSFKERLNHKKCRRKQVYQHNIATPTEIFKCRMRERELQILEAARMKRSCDYLDPVTGFNRTMEALKKNDELIIIPKMPPITASKSIFTPMYHKNRNNTTSNINSSNNANNNNCIKNILGNKKIHNVETNKELTSEMISNIILSCQNSINSTNQSEKVNRLLPKQIKSSDHLSGGTVNIMNTSNLQNQQQLKITEVLPNGNTSNSINKQPQLIVNTGPPLNSINLNVPQSQQFIKTTGLQVNNKINAESLQQLNLNSLMQSNPSHATPLKVGVELKSESSLLYQKKEVPKFSVVPDLSAIPQIVPKKKKPYQIKNDKKQQTFQLSRLLPKTSRILSAGKIRPLQSVLSGSTYNKDEKMLAGTALTKKQKVRKRPRKKLQRKGKFRCSKCGKRFSSLDYCRLHMNQHENNLDFFCKICEKGFPNMHYAKKHMKSDHLEGEVRCEVCNSILSSMEELLKHMKCPEIKTEKNCTECSESFETCNSLDIHMKKNHGFRICTICKRQVAKSQLKRHLVLIHTISKNRSETAFEKLSYAPSENDKICDVDLISETKVKEESILKIEPLKKIVVDGDCLARNRSIRRRNSKEVFKCAVCDRQFENEKQYQIHLANNPMKFTPCPGCGKKFHRKSECTEHCKSCNFVTSIQVGHIPKRRKSNPLSEKSILKINNDIASQNSIDRKQDELLETNKCKKLKLNEEKIVQKKDVEDQQDKEDTIILKTNIESKIVNGLKQNSSDYVDILNVVKTKNEDSEVVKSSDKKVLLLTAKQESINSNDCTIFDRSIAVAHINQDHNYQALR